MSDTMTTAHTRKCSGKHYEVIKRGRSYAITQRSTGALVAICVYLKGAAEVVRRLEAAELLQPPVAIF